MSEPKWKLNSAAALTWRAWGDESVVFDAQTGDTHLLDAVAREGLLSFCQVPFARSEVCVRLAERLKIEPDDQLDEYVGKLVARFSELGLVERVTS